ncbi:anthrone oxygenase family protein [Sinomicrobium sp.]
MKLKQISLYVCIVLTSGILFTNLYNSLVDATSWGADIPDSIRTVREYYKSVNPGNYYRGVTPVVQLICLLTVLLFWKSSKQIRYYLLIALIIYLIGDVLTFTYFYPRNEFVFQTGNIKDINAMEKAITEWQNMNWVRSVLVVISIVLYCMALHKTYRLQGLK